MFSKYIYECSVSRVIDGDTLDVDIDLGFNVILYKQRLRLFGINTPETRTRDLEEKQKGLKAKERLKELVGNYVLIRSLGKGKYGRILAVPYLEDGTSICDILIEEGHAVAYDGG
jgi:micrococcal nuclease